jgi:outer membrane protein assembly factor BamD (BamD/ComL family)
MIAAAQPSAKKLLADARAALARGDTRRARECVAGALKAAPQARHRAIAQLLLADTLLVESRYPAALAAYRRTMDVFGGYPEGETAAFALAQLLSERGPEKQARDALERYLARYPRGRFAEEVEKKLANSPAP